MNPFIFIANAEIAHELYQVIGVFTSATAAVARCVERKFAAEDEKGLGSMPYDRHWIEQWELDGGYILTYDVVDGKIVGEHE